MESSGDGSDGTATGDPRGNKHVLVVADPFTKWVEAFPVPDMGAETVAQVVVREIICRFGILRALHSDQREDIREQSDD